jgi:hypothetical protein
VDSRLLRQHDLIDYSVFLLDIDLDKKFRAKQDKGIKSLVYNALDMEYTLMTSVKEEELAKSQTVQT